MKKIIFTIMLLLAMNVVSATLELDNIQFDPAIIASGDQVDIVIQFHESSKIGDKERISNPDWTFKVNIKPDDTLTEKYVLIQDSEGDNLHGTIFSGESYNKKFRVKVFNDAPAGDYEFKLEGVWYFKGNPEDTIQSTKFIMPVKKEGIILDISSLETVPSEVRPGDNYVKIVARVENAGEKDAKSVEINLETPENIESSYTNNNRVWVGKVNAGENKEISFYIDVDEKAKSGIYQINYTFDYMDLDNNKYSKEKDIPFLIQSRPYLEVVNVEGSGLAGDKSQLKITVKNTGEESAESVDVRIIKQNTQPFNIDVRSDYIGELNPGEEGVAIFDIDVNRDAAQKEHDFKVIIRAKGDTDEGDDNIYTFNRRAQFEVNGESSNKFLNIGIMLLATLIGFVLISFILRRLRK